MAVADDVHASIEVACMVDIKERTNLGHFRSIRDWPRFDEAKLRLRHPQRTLDPSFVKDGSALVVEDNGGTMSVHFIERGPRVERTWSRT